MYLNSLARHHFAGRVPDVFNIFGGARRRSRSSLRRCNWVWNVATQLAENKKGKKKKRALNIRGCLK